MIDEKTLKEINDTMRKLEETFQELKEKLLDAWDEAIELPEKLEREIQKAFEKNEEHKRLLRRPPKWYSKVNTPAILVSRNKLYHCRNNC